MVLNGAGGNIELPCFSEAVGPTKIMPEEAIDFLHLVIDNRVIVNMAGETVCGAIPRSSRAEEIRVYMTKTCPRNLGFSYNLSSFGSFLFDSFVLTAYKCQVLHKCGV